jgi:hypothetical protein
MGALEPEEFGAVGPLAPRLRAAFARLLEAYAYARDLHRDLWDFAVEIGSLRAEGLTLSDLRWLACKGYVEHAREVTHADGPRRVFRPGGELVLSKRTCFVLTERGLAMAESMRRASADADPPVPPAEATVSLNPQDVAGGEPPSIPRWDAELRELWVGGKLVKQFRLPSPNQERILTAFEEEGWPPRIDDPLPPHPEQDPKRRLHDTIKSLNRNQAHRLLRLYGDGTGEGVRWELVDRGAGRAEARRSSRLGQGRSRRPWSRNHRMALRANTA